MSYVVYQLLLLSPLTLNSYQPKNYSLVLPYHRSFWLDGLNTNNWGKIAVGLLLTSTGIFLQYYYLKKKYADT
jgi:hypothetical protein